MRTKALALLISLACLFLIGCKKDAEVKTIIADFDSFTNELVKRVDSAPNTAGVDDAQKYFDSKKADMTVKMTTLKGIRGYQVGDETKKAMESSLVDDAKKVANLQLKYIGASMRDADFKAKLEKLTRDYQSLFKM
jgi:hypothetical protein